MAHYEVVLTSRGIESVVRTGIRRENGAIAERDIAVRSEAANKRGRGGRVAQGPVGDRDPNGIAVVWYDDIASITTVITYRRVGPYVPEPTPDVDLTDALLASLIAIGA